MYRYTVTVGGGRDVHYRRSGQGPPVVLLHASPAGSGTLVALGRQLAERFTVYAIDTPGHGGSDPLAVPEPAIADYGRALGETLVTLGLERVHLYGTHTGAKIGLALACQRPNQVVALFLDGVGVATPAERADQRARYTPRFAPRGDGGHLLAAWHQVRNMFLFWPWYRERDNARFASPMPVPRELHELAVGMLVAGEDYPLAYQAAFACDPVPMLSRVAVPTVVVAAAHDPLHAQLARIANTADNVRVLGDVPGGSDVAGLAAAVTAHFLDHGEGVPDAPATVEQGRASRFANGNGARLHLHCAGSGAAGRPLVLLPPAPASGAAMDWLLRSASVDRPVVAVDLPGTADSELGGATDAASMGQALLACLDELGLGGVDVLGVGCGATIALEMAAHAPRRVHAVVVAGRPVRMAWPDLTPDPLGLHLVRAWHLLRDRALGRPPSGQEASAVDLEACHARTLDVVKAVQTYAVAPRAAARADGGREQEDRVRRAGVPVLRCAPPADDLAFVAADGVVDLAASPQAILAALEATG